MARKKMNPELSLNELDENSEENLDPDTELDSNEESNDEEDVAPKAKRKSRKRKEPVGVAALLAGASEPEPVPVNENADEEKFEEKLVEKVEAKPKRASKPRTKLVVEEAPKAEVPVAAAAASVTTDEPVELTASLDLAASRPVDDAPKADGETVRPWAAMKEVSQGMVQNLERISHLLKSPAAPRPTLVTKLALGFSAAALLLSLVSLSLAQSARQQAIALRATPAEVIAESRAARRTERPNEEITRMAKEVARTATAPLAPPPAIPTARPTDSPKETAPKAAAATPKARPATKRRAKTAAAVATPKSVREAKSMNATANANGLLPDAARVKALNDLARTAPSRRRVVPTTAE